MIAQGRVLRVGAAGNALFGQGVAEVPVEGVQVRQRRRGDLRTQKGKDQHKKTMQRPDHGFDSERSGLRA